MAAEAVGHYFPPEILVTRRGIKKKKTQSVVTDYLGIQVWLWESLLCSGFGVTSLNSAADQIENSNSILWHSQDKETMPLNLPSSKESTASQKAVSSV